MTTLNMCESHIYIFRHQQINTTNNNQHHSYSNQTEHCQRGHCCLTVWESGCGCSQKGQLWVVSERVHNFPLPETPRVLHTTAPVKHCEACWRLQQVLTCVSVSDPSAVTDILTFKQFWKANKNCYWNTYCKHTILTIAAVFKYITFAFTTCTMVFFVWQSHHPQTQLEHALM